MIEGPSPKPTGRKPVHGRVDCHIQSSSVHMSSSTDPHHGRRHKRIISKQDQIQIGRMGEGWREVGRTGSSSSARTAAARPIGALRPSSVGQSNGRYTSRGEYDAKYDHGVANNDMLSGARDPQHRNIRRHIPSEPSETTGRVGLVTTFGHGGTAWQEHQRRRIAVKESLDDDIHQRPFVRRQVIEDHNHIHQSQQQQQQKPDQSPHQQRQQPTVEISPASPSPTNANNGMPDAAGQPSSRTNGSNQRLTTLESEPTSISPSRRRVPAPWPVQQEHRRVPCATPVSPHRIPGGYEVGGSAEGGYVGGSTSLWTSKDVWENHKAGRKQFRDNAARPPSAIGAAGVPWALG